MIISADLRPKLLQPRFHFLARAGHERFRKQTLVAKEQCDVLFPIVVCLVYFNSRAVPSASKSSRMTLTAAS